MTAWAACSRRREWISATSLVTTLSAYDDANRKTTTTLANGLVTTETYNRAGELISVDNGTASALTSLGITTYSYDAGGRLRIVTDPTGVRQFFFYDEADRKVGQVDGDGTLTEFVYNKASQLIKTIQYSVLLSSTRWPRWWTARGIPTAVTLATCRTEAGTTPATDQVTRNVYDLPAGWCTPSTQSARSRRSSTTAQGASRTIEYANTIAYRVHRPGAAGRPDLERAHRSRSCPTPRRSAHAFVLRRRGNQIGSLDAAGYLTENVYDAAGHLKQTTGYANVTSSASGRAAPGHSSRLRPAPIRDDHRSGARHLYLLLLRRAGPAGRRARRAKAI